jgi:parvulin-like peptidyl-prolyl isomerase
MFAQKVKTLNIRRFFQLALLGLPLILLLACRQQDNAVLPSPTRALPAAPVEVTSDSAQPRPTELVTPAPPTSTPLPPLAALVNDQPIFLADFERELARYEQAQLELGSAGGAAADHRRQVLDALIEQALIEQAAVANGITIPPALVDQKLDELRDLAGGPENLEAWLQANLYTPDEFRQALAAEMMTEALVEFITRDVPYAVEQVRARYIQVDDGALATSLRQQIEAGADFGLLAQTHSLDRVTGQNGGDLGGYFAPGSLLVPEVEQAAFDLAVGATSEVVAVSNSAGGTTYYLVQLIERDPQRPLDANARYNMLRHTFETWLTTVWAEAEIVRFVN